MRIPGTRAWTTPICNIAFLIFHAVRSRASMAARARPSSWPARQWSQTGTLPVRWSAHSTALALAAGTGSSLLHKLAASSSWPSRSIWYAGTDSEPQWLSLYPWPGPGPSQPFGTAAAEHPVSRPRPRAAAVLWRIYSRFSTWSFSTYPIFQTILLGFQYWTYISNNYNSNG